MQRIFRLISRVAPTDSTVLIVGESGTGKELVARAIHLQSRRANGPFVPVNCGALPETLIESELFGYARGAFTGAQTARAGLIEEADGGTLFLDEIGEMPLITQVKLLRTLENDEVRRLGENETRLVNVRTLAATNKDLHAEVLAGRFREDLFYRLNVVTLELPPLRERREDVGLLATYFLERASRKLGRSALRFSPQAMEAIERYDYPGNVRELENAVERAATLTEGPIILPDDLPPVFLAPRLLPRPGQGVEARPAAASEAHPPRTEPAAAPLGPQPAHPRDTWSLAQLEQEHIQRVLAFHRGNVTAAARQLGISRTTLWRKMRAYGIRRQ
jgi:DNA-binding NtrC family response regulator